MVSHTAWHRSLEIGRCPTVALGRTHLALVLPNMAYVCSLAAGSASFSGGYERCRWRVLGFDASSPALLATVCGKDDRLITVDQRWNVRAWDLRTLVLLAQGALPLPNDLSRLSGSTFRLLEGFSCAFAASDPTRAECIDRCWLVRTASEASADAYHICAWLISIRHGGDPAASISCSMCTLALPIPASSACMLGTLDGRRLVVAESVFPAEDFREMCARKPAASKPEAIWEVELLQDACHSSKWFRRLGRHPFVQQ